MSMTSLMLTKEGLVIITPEDERILNDEVIIKNYFDNLAKKEIKKMTRSSDKEIVSITYKDNSHVKFQNFNEIRKKRFSKELNKQLSIYKFKRVAEKLTGKKIITVGSIVGIASVSIINLDIQKEPQINAITFENENSTSQSEEFNTETKRKINLAPIEIKLNDIDDEPVITEEKQSGTIVPDRDYSNLDIDDELDIDPLSLVDSGDIDDAIDQIFADNDIKVPELNKEEIVKDTNLSNTEQKENIDTEEINSEIKTINSTNDNLDYTNFTALKDIDNYEGFINVAANLYGVDYQKATELVKEKWDTFKTPGNPVNEHYAQELDRMKDLVSRGFINGDMNVIGIFLTIKDYAIDNLNLSNQPAIPSNKTQEEREKDILNIAKYVYGIDDDYLLNLLIATTRVESANFTSAATINKNNIGGNMSTAGTFEHPVLNTYKTAELGEESFVRNFLNCYGKSLVAHNYDRTIPVPYVMKDKLCPHTPDEWAKVITEKVEYVQASGIVDAYLGNSSKTI